MTADKNQSYIPLEDRLDSNAKKIVNMMKDQPLNVQRKVQSYLENAVDIHKSKNSNLRYRFTIVHCREPIEQIQWIHTLPSNWDIIVYETCLQNVSKYSRPFINSGSEECTAYLTTMMEDHDDPYDVSVFVQSDVLLGSGRVKYLDAEHSPFWTSAQLVETVEQWAEKKDGSGLLMFGPRIHAININSTLPYIQTYGRDIFDIMELPYSETTSVVGRSGACFAVRKERISSIDKQKLITLRDRVYHPNKNVKKPSSRRMCCGFERTWHAILGEDYDISRASSVDHLWEPVVRNTNGKWNGKLFLNYTMKDDLEKYVWDYHDKKCRGVPCNTKQK
ncbi:hypothetical protein CTEN210_10281 [Chaetoceros tenuissimus]|uniref:Uncharacterized protein n=1 Tax=Chaetoceros tenuissimus TaxID=426638 RepID=A0AAD3CZD5_9STRA|nr:hypothetical protein CTEN210_10281 [Chaetoceros tenuissimus]